MLVPEYIVAGDLPDAENAIVVDGALAYVHLAKERGIAIIDAEDVNRVKEYHWSLTVKGYVRGTRDGEVIYLHRLILGDLASTHTDHRNTNKLDNRKGNLRPCNNSQNLQHRGLQRNNTSGYKGVSFDGRYNRWEAHIWAAGKRYWLGWHRDKADAARAYNEAALYYHGEFAVLNEIGGEDVKI